MRPCTPGGAKRCMDTANLDFASLGSGFGQCARSKYHAKKIGREKIGREKRARKEGEKIGREKVRAWYFLAWAGERERRQKKLEGWEKKRGRGRDWYENGGRDSEMERQHFMRTALRQWGVKIKIQSVWWTIRWLLDTLVLVSWIFAHLHRSALSIVLPHFSQIIFPFSLNFPGHYVPQFYFPVHRVSVPLFRFFIVLPFYISNLFLSFSFQNLTPNSPFFALSLHNFFPSVSSPFCLSSSLSSHLEPGPIRVAPNSRLPHSRDARNQVAIK